MSWKDKLKLNEGDVLVEKSTFSSGHQGQNEKTTYQWKSAAGGLLGEVVHNVHVSTTKPFNESVTVRQFRADGTEIQLND